MTGLRLCVAALLLATAGCTTDDDRSPIAIAAIGPAADQALAGATGAGLLRLDDDGQLAAGVALRWALSDGGRDAVFRIDEAARMPAATIARRLQSAIRRPDGIVHDLLAGAEVAAVTDTVIEVRVAQEQPELLTILADPTLAALAPGAGPMRIAAHGSGGMLLTGRQSDPPLTPIQLRSTRAGAAVLRFRDRRADLVVGGTFADLPVARAAGIAPAFYRFDPASGLFGLAIRARRGAYATPAIRQALSLAIDRDRIVRLIAASGQAKAATVAGSTDEMPLPDRSAFARRLVAEAGALPVVRLALPTGPGATLLFRLLADDWRAIGVATERVGIDAPADLALIDIVAPASTHGRLACAAAADCDVNDARALFAPPFIPIATPVRWSLVAKDIEGFEANSLAAHPIERLRRR